VAPNRHTLLFALIMVASLFFIWGFCHAMLDVLNKHFQNILHVSKAQSGLVQTSVFGAYLLVALPAALLIRRIGYQKGILLGLVVWPSERFCSLRRVWCSNHSPRSASRCSFSRRAWRSSKPPPTPM
jgi:MFS family permease